MLALVATCLVAAMAAAPTAGAASAGNAKAKSAATPKAQASVTKRKLARDIRTVRRRANRNRRAIITLQSALATLGTELRTAITGGDKTIDDKINGIVGAVTPVLQRLGTAALDLEAGLKKLADATTAGFGEVEAALTDIGDFLGATEYGFAQIFVNANAQGGSFLVTPNIPDDAQQAQTSQHFVAQHSGDIVVLYGVRSSENDGTGADNPAAHCRVTVVNEDASEVGSTPPNGDLGGLPFQPVNDKSATTSTAPGNTGFPFGMKANSTGPPAGEEDKTTTLPTTVTVAAGDVYEVDLACVDISASADDPEA